MFTLKSTVQNRLIHQVHQGKYQIPKITSSIPFDVRSNVNGQILSSIRYNNINFILQKSKYSSSSSTNEDHKSKSNKKWPFYLFCFTSGIGIAYFLPLYTIYNKFFEDPLPLINTPLAIEHSQKLEIKLNNLSIVRNLKNSKDWKISRAWDRVEQHLIDGSLTGSLSQPGGIAIKPIIFTNLKTREEIMIVHLGRRLCGFPFLVHGGILATILDETLSRSSLLDNETFLEKTNINGLKPKALGLSLSYRFPTRTNQFVVVRTKVENVDGKDVIVTGDVETVHGRKLVIGTGRFAKKGRPTFLSRLSGLFSGVGLNI